MLRHFHLELSKESSHKSQFPVNTGAFDAASSSDEDDNPVEGVTNDPTSLGRELEPQSNTDMDGDTADVVNEISDNTDVVNEISDNTDVANEISDNTDIANEISDSKQTANNKNKRKTKVKMTENTDGSANITQTQATSPKVLKNKEKKTASKKKTRKEVSKTVNAPSAVRQAANEVRAAIQLASL